MWQDGLALLIVLLAVWMLVRIYAPNFSPRRSANSEQKPIGGCGGCAVRSSCSSAERDAQPK